MEISIGLPTARPDKDTVLTLGTFDGVHLGHQAIIRRLTATAKRIGGRSVVVTFEPHPQLVVKRSDRPQIKLLSTLDEKTELQRGLGVESLVVLKFDSALAALSAQEFVQSILSDGLRAARVIVGYDHTFGKKRQGGTENLRELGKKLGFQVEVVEPLSVDGVTVSSTKIRHALAYGDVAAAARLLGRNYWFHGAVVPGDGRGKTLGFPTANLQPSSANKLVPQSGIYAVLVHLNGETLRGVLNIGRRPTFDSTKNENTIEVHLNDYDGTLYGKQLCVEFVGRIREERRFESSARLAEQILRDKEASMVLLEGSKRRTRCP